MEEHKYQLVIQLPSNSDNDATEILELEETIQSILENTPHQVDGYDIGSGTMNIFVDTNYPEAALSTIFAKCDIANNLKLLAAYRSFDDEDYILIWPKDSNHQFKLI